ncbi:uncharacterized protein LOC117781848 [Drosophila innubila]|uniref:uncharacterized protein LOC117781848 n=1 Tax=Drosophila innubila TaxID=198719 RepID=UPI00148E0D33|nr:uncharacterized protein LOC117781848 [Drosophila innubila]
MIIVLLLLFQSLCLYCQRLVLHIHDRCFPRNARLLQEVAETVGDRKALQHLEHLEQEKSKRRQKRRILEPILPLGAGLNLEACRFCAHSPQGYCRHHFHLQLHTRRLTVGSGNGYQGGEQDYKQQRRIRRELKRSLEQQQPRRNYQSYQYYQSPSVSSLSSGYASLSPSQEETQQQLQQEAKEEEEGPELITSDL